MASIFASKTRLYVRRHSFPDFENSLPNEYDELFSSLLSSERNSPGEILLVARKRFCEVTALRNFVNVLARHARYWEIRFYAMEKQFEYRP